MRYIVQIREQIRDKGEEGGARAFCMPGTEVPHTCNKTQLH